MKKTASFYMMHINAPLKGVYVSLLTLPSSSVLFKCLFAGIIFFGISCKSTHQKVMESSDYGLKMEYAQKYMEDENYSRAKPLLQDLIRYYRGTDRADELYYMYAEAQYKTDNYMLAAHYYKTLADTYPHSEYAERSLYMHAYSFYQISPRPSLDQTNTRRALQGFQLFVNRYPYSDLVEQSHNYMDELRRKLEIKAINNAMLYHKIGDYRAAVWAIESVLKRFPGTNRREELEFLMLESSFKFAENSVPDMQAERFNETIQYYHRFNENFPESDKQNQAREIYDDARTFLNNL